MSRSGVGVFARPKWEDMLVGRRFKYLMDYLFWVGTSVVYYAKTVGLELTDLCGEDVVRSKVEACLKDKNPIFFFHASHGDYDMITGQNNCNLICCSDHAHKLKKNHDVLQNRITYTLSCKSAKKLGPQIIKRGGISYLGYNSNLRICLFEGSELDGAFKDIWVGGAKLLLGGKTVKEAYDWVMRRYEYWISYWEMSEHWARPFMLSTLRQDHSAFKLLGKEDARVFSK